MDDEAVFQLKVECYAGHRGEETPRRLIFGNRIVEVVSVLDCWLGEDHRYFKISGSDNFTYILRHDEKGDEWEIIMFDRSKNKQP